MRRWIVNKPETPRAQGLAVRLYRLLLLAYPASFRREYGEPMVQLFRDCSASAFSEAGYWGLVKVCGRTLGDLIYTALREHVARLKRRRPVLVGNTVPITPRAQRSLEIALHEAKAAGRVGIGPEQILLGLIEEGTGVAGYVLRRFNMNARRAREQATLPQFAATEAVTENADFVPVLIRSAETEARRLGHAFVGTEHLLLGLIGERRASLEPFFQSLGVSMEEVQREILDTIAATPL
jgi:ATP-dependent Clp protease ATP-binding subunit ClpA